MYGPPAGDGPAFCANLTMTPPPWRGVWRRVTGGWLREAAPQPPAPTPEPRCQTPTGAEAAEPTTDEEHRRVRFRPGPPRKRSRESRLARDRAYSRAYRRAGRARRRVLTPESRLRVRERMRRYLPRWRRQNGYYVTNRIRVTWARAVGDAEWHLIPTIGSLRRRPPAPNTRLCARHQRITKLIMPFPSCWPHPARRCPDCVAARSAWEAMVAKPMR